MELLNPNKAKVIGNSWVWIIIINLTFFSETENNMVWKFEEDFSVDDELMERMAKAGEQRKVQSNLKKLAVPETVEREVSTPIG